MSEAEAGRRAGGRKIQFHDLIQSGRKEGRKIGIEGG